MTLSGPPAEAVEHRGNVQIRQQPRQFADDPLSVGVGLPTVLATPILDDLESGVITTLPMDRQPEPSFLDLHDDFANNGT